jgi:hypothetical protein
MQNYQDHLLSITQLQFVFQNRLNGLADLVLALYESSSVETQATLPMIEADLCVLRSLDAQIGRGIERGY